jgi:hypothetical protein
MKKSWDLESFEIISMRIETEEYQQHLDEFTELVYNYFCQLTDKTKASELTMDHTIKRTGTDE